MTDNQPLALNKKLIQAIFREKLVLQKLPKYLIAINFI
jgi:hypothetical protein